MTESHATPGGFLKGITLSSDQIHRLEQIDIPLDNGTDEPKEISVNAIFIPSVLVSMVDELMGPYYSSPGEYIIEQLRQHILWGRK